MLKAQSESRMLCCNLWIRTASMRANAVLKMHWPRLVLKNKSYLSATKSYISPRYSAGTCSTSAAITSLSWRELMKVGRRESRCAYKFCTPMSFVANKKVRIPACAAVTYSFEQL